MIYADGVISMKKIAFPIIIGVLGAGAFATVLLMKRSGKAKSRRGTQRRRPPGRPGPDHRPRRHRPEPRDRTGHRGPGGQDRSRSGGLPRSHPDPRSEEHTSELQSRGHLVCRPLLENKKMTLTTTTQQHR